MTVIRRSPSGPNVDVSGENFSTAIYPQSYGAVGDGVTDDTVALQEWLDATASLGRAGAIPSGTYLISDELYVSDGGGEIYGDGFGLSIIKWAGENDDGKAMVVWGRRRGSLSGVTLQCLSDDNNRATHGFVLQNGFHSFFNMRVLTAARHGVVVWDTWGGRPAGSNHNTVFEQCIVENSGDYTTMIVRTNASAGTFTLTIEDYWSNTYTTAAIAFNADADTIAAAMQAANPKTYDQAESWLSKLGTDAFYGAGSENGFEIVRVWGVLAGHPITITIDDSGLTGGPADFSYSEPKRGNGFNMETGCGIDNNVITLRDCSINGNAGHGVQIFAAGFFVDHGLYEGNYDAGIKIGDGVGVSITNNIVLWPWLEGNASGGVISDDNANGNLVLTGPGLQGAAGGATLYLTPVDGSLHVAQFLGATQRYTRIAPDVISSTSGSQLGLAGTFARDPAIQTTSGVVVMSVLGTNDVILGLDGNVTSLTLSNPVPTQVITLSMIHNGAPRTVAFAQTVLWAGGPGGAPVLGSGGAGSWDVLVLRWHFGSWHEVSRSLGLKT